MSNKTTKNAYFTEGFTHPAISSGQNGSGLSLFEGRIQSYDYKNGTYMVLGGERQVGECINVSTLLSGLLGLKVNTILEVGTSVLVLQNTLDNNKSYILGTIGSGDTASGLYMSDYVGTNPESNVLKNLIDQEGESNNSSYNTADGSFISNLAPGETSIHNATGAAIQLLHCLATLKATDLAKIECMVQDDMVRIISKTFQSINSLGEYTIFNENGKLNVVWKGTNKEFESFGSESEGKTGLGNISGGVLNEVLDGPSEHFDEDGRWRFQSYIGQLGNFIHLFITDPNKILKNDQTCIPGRANLHVNEDGSVLVQSLSDIAFEKVVRIPVPTEKKRWEEADPGGEIDPESMKNWTTMGDEELWQMSYKLADYGRWFAQTYCNSGFISNNRYNEIDESSMEDADPFAKDNDRQKVDGAFQKDFKKTQEAYATIRIFKDGSIVLMDAYGSSVHLAGGYLQLSAAKDLNIHATGNLNISANDIAITGLNSVVASAVEGSIDIAGKEMARVASTEGFTVIESTMSNSDTIDESTNEAVKKLKDKAKIKDKYFSVIINGADTEYGNILINAKGLLVNFAKDFMTKALNMFITVRKSFTVSKVLQYLENKLLISPITHFVRLIESEENMVTKSIRPIPMDDTKKISAMSFDSGLEKKKEDTSNISEFDIKETDLDKVYNSTLPNFDYPEYDVEEKELMQTLSDQYYEDMSEKADENKVEEKQISDLEIGGKAKGFPFPGKNKKMKVYRPTVGWDFKEPQTAPKRASQISQTQYSTYFKKKDD